MFNSRTISNPQASESELELPIITPYVVYSKNKSHKRQIQHTRNNFQNEVSFLERNTNKEIKDLHSKQKKLLSHYRLKEDRFITTQRKQQLQEKRSRQLDQLRHTNRTFREISSARRRQAAEELRRSHLSSAQKIKNNHRSIQNQRSLEKRIENQLLQKRNTAFSKSNKIATKFSKAKSVLQNQCRSSFVKNQLIQIQNTVKEKQKQRIKQLTQKQRQLKYVVQKAKKERMDYEKVLSKTRDMSFNQLYANVIEKGLVKNRNKNHQRSVSKAHSFRSLN